MKIVIYFLRVVVFLIIVGSVSIDYAAIPESDRFGKFGAFALVFIATIAVGDSLLDVYRRQQIGRHIGVIRSAYLIVLFVLGSAAVLRAFVAFVPLEAELFKEPGPYTDQELWLFTLDQTLKGLFFDFMEIFHITIGRLHHNPDVIIFTGAIFVYRAFFSAIIVGLLVAFIRKLQGRQIINYTAPR